MKEIVITPKRQKAELRNLLICFVVAYLTNVCSILIYHTSWKELYTQICPVLVLTGIFYFATWVIRVGFYLIKHFVHK